MYFYSLFFFFFKQKTAYEMRISDWSSDVCSSDLAHSEIITAGQEMDAVLVMREGWAARFKTLEDGRRQILNILLPGDIFDLQVLVAAEADHSVVTVKIGRAHV